MFIVRNRNIFFSLAGIILAASVAAIAFFGMPLSIDFTGGSLVEVAYEAERPALATLQERVSEAGIRDASVRESGERGVIVRARTLAPEEYTALISSLSSGGAESVQELRFNSIGPSLGTELATKALYALGAVILAIVLYITWAFRKVSRPLSSFVYGGIVVLILIHDVLVPAGFYALYAHFTGAQVDTLFVVAILAILGYSVNDTIVIFDRIRERLKKNEETETEEAFEEVVGHSIVDTLGRSINTSLTVVLALLALLIVGNAATFNFTVVLLAGVVAGTYSSVLVAAPLLIPLAKRFARAPKEEAAS